LRGNTSQVTANDLDKHQRKCYTFNRMNIERLKQLQGNLTNKAFADKLGIHRVSWERIKNRRVPVSDKFLVRVHRAFPELNIFLPTDVANTSRAVSEASQDSKLGRLTKRLRGLYLRVKQFTVKQANR